MKKKILSFILSIALLAGMILSPLPAEAFDFSGSDTEYKLSYTPKLMTEAEGNYPFRYDADGELKVATQKWERVTRQGYANITTYKAPEDGTFGTINKNEGDTAYVQFSEEGAIVEFCIADNDGNILYPYNNNVLTIDDNEQHSFNDIELSVKKGQEINIIFYGVKCNGTIGFDFIAHMSFKNSAGTMTRIDNTFRLWPPSGVATQGSDNLYFKYADDYAKVADAGLDMGSVYQKKLNLGEKQLMVNTPDNSYWTLGVSGVSGTGTLGWKKATSGVDIGIAKGFANIVTFKAPESGTFQVRNMTLSLSNYETKALDFAITDKNGYILYPTDQSVLTIGGEVASQSSITFKHEMEKDEEINFVCFNSNGDYSGIGMTAEIYMNGTSYCSGNIWPGSNSTIWPDGTEAVLSNIDPYYQYYYSAGVTVENLLKAPWSEFVSLDKYETAPNTIETWVKISEAVADNKRGIIVSNGGVTGYNDDLTIAMDYNGNPRIYSASKEFDFTVNADLRTGEWTHLAFVNDQVNNKMYCYINGELKGVCNDSYDNAKYGTGYSYVIGNNNYYDQGNAFQGEIRDLRFWSDVRSASEISDNQNATLKGKEEGLLGTWALNDYSSTVTYFTDRTSASNHGQIVSPYDKFVRADAVKDYDYSMAVIGDTQYYVESETNVEQFYAMTEYMAGLDKKPEYVMQVGDITSDNGENHYTKAYRSMNTLTTAGIPHSIALGNHDYPSAGKVVRDSSMFNKYFNQAYYETTGDMEFYPEYYEVSADSTNTKWEVIASDAETVSDGQIKLSDIVNTRPCEAQNIVEGDYVSLKTDNHYRFITAGNTKYMMLALEFNPRNAVIEWANEVVAAHPDYKVIVLTHGYTENGELIDSSAYYLNNGSKDMDQNEPNVLWDRFVSKHENIFMLFCGHSHAPEITSNVMVGDNGNTVYQYMVAPTMGNGGDGVFLMMYFNEAKGVVDFRYYSPTEDKYWGYQNMLQIDLDNSNTNTNIVEVAKPNIATDVTLTELSSDNLGTWWTINQVDATHIGYKAYFKNTGEVQVTEKSSLVKQYVATADGTAKILMRLAYVRVNGGGVDPNKKANIDIQIYNTNGENITALFNKGSSFAGAVAGTGSSNFPDCVNGTFNMVSDSSQNGYIYAEIPDVKAGDSFYFVSTGHDMSSAENPVCQDQIIYISSNIAPVDAEKVTVEGVEGEWISSVKDFPTTAIEATKRQGHLGWYYKYVSNSVLKNYTYSAKKAEVDVNIVGDGSISTYTTSAIYDAATGKIALPHDNSLFVDVKKSEGSVLSAVYWNDIPVAHTTSTDASIRVNVPCVGNGGTLTVIFKPITESVTIDGVPTYFDYGTQELGDVNGTDGIDVRDLVRTVSHLEDSTVAIKAYNTDINKDKKIDKGDTSALRGMLLE